MMGNRKKDQSKGRKKQRLKEKEGQQKLEIKIEEIQIGDIP